MKIGESEKIILPKQGSTENLLHNVNIYLSTTFIKNSNILVRHLWPCVLLINPFR